MSWILVVVTTVSVLNGHVETTTTETKFKTAEQCAAAMAPYRPGRNGIRIVYCRKNNEKQV